jgi:LysM repeat protein
MTPPGGTYDLKVPADSVDRIVAALAAPKKTVVARIAAAPARVAPGSVHVVRQRETVRSIAKQYGVSVVDLLRLNSLEPDDVIRPGDRLRIATAR